MLEIFYKNSADKVQFPKKNEGIKASPPLMPIRVNTPTALLRVWNQSLIVQKNTTDYDLAKEVQKTAQEKQILQMTFKQAME